MASNGKNFRYYYWLVLEFFKKQFKSIILSTVISIILIVALISFAPQLYNILIPSKQVIGIIGQYTENNLPDEILTKISNGLLFLDSNGSYIPALASNWEVVDNGREYRIFLKKDIFWNDGKTFKAEEINYQFKDIGTKCSNQLVTFKLKNPLATFPSYLTKPIVDYDLNGVAGLYKVVRTKKKYDYFTEIHLSPNKTGLPTIIYRFYDNESKLISAYKTGEISEMVLYNPELAKIFEGWHNTEVTKSIDYTRLLTLFLNSSSPAFKNKEIRQAVSMAINKSSFENLGFISDSPIPPVSWAYNSNLKKEIFDLDAARNVLRKKEDATDSAKLNLYTYYEYSDMADTISEMLNKAGLKNEVNIASNFNPDFDMLLAYWKVPSDPDQYFFWHSIQKQGNISNYKNVKVDKLLEDGRSTTSIADRKKIYFEFQKVIIDDDPAVFLYFPFSYIVKRK